MLKFVVLFALLCGAYSVGVLNCLNPWQQPMMSGTKIVTCTASNPINCAKGRNANCVFTYVTFNYICCEDNATAIVPNCPKYYDSLRTVCNPQSSNSCPFGYQCLFTTNANMSICCSYNPNKPYPEPSSSFADLGVTPKYLPIAPTNLLGVNNFKIGQEVLATDLATTPIITYLPKDNVTYYTIMAFDINIAAPAAGHYLVVNARANSLNRTWIDFETNPAAKIKAWATPANNVPVGEHNIIFALFEQKAKFMDAPTPPIIPAAADVKATAWDVAAFLTQFKDGIGSILAGNYVTITTVAAAGK